MKIVHILRHAKTEEGRAKPDRERKLTDRGVRCAHLLGTYMRQNKIMPDLILCSTATRARETLDHLLTGLECTPDIEYQDRLYMADVAQISSAIAEADNAHSNILVIAHNPGLQLFAAEKTFENEDNDGRIYEGFPTASMATIHFAVSDWAEISQRNVRGNLAAYVEPTDLV